MDIDFIVQDTFALTRPQWKLAANIEEAAKAFQLAIAQDKKTAGLDKSMDADDGSTGSSSDDENIDPDLPEGEVEGDEESGSEEEDGEEIENSEDESASEDEAIVVTRQEEEVDPEDEAEFQREYAKMMAESLESRKFERKSLFDLPLPVRAKSREVSSMSEPHDGNVGGPGTTMAFSLLTKKGNRQQVCLDLFLRGDDLR
jgi:regulator of nonsense transcripts 2